VNGAARVTYTGRPGTTKEAELSALVSVYSFLIKSSQGKKNAAVGRGKRDDLKEERR
jgi:hypothetical protein